MKGFNQHFQDWNGLTLRNIFLFVCCFRIPLENFDDENKLKNKCPHDAEWYLNIFVCVHFVGCTGCQVYISLTDYLITYLYHIFDLYIQGDNPEDRFPQWCDSDPPDSSDDTVGNSSLRNCRVWDNLIDSLTTNNLAIIILSIICLTVLPLGRAQLIAT